MLTKFPGESVKAILSASKTGRENEIIVFTESACVHLNEITEKMKKVKLLVENLIVVEGGMGKNGNLIYI